MLGHLICLLCWGRSLYFLAEGCGKSTHGIKDIKSPLEDIYYWRSLTAVRPAILFKTIKHFQSMGKTNNRCWQQHRPALSRDYQFSYPSLHENTFTQDLILFSKLKHYYVWLQSSIAWSDSCLGRKQTPAQCSNGIAIWLSVAECEKWLTSFTNIVYQQPGVFILLSSVFFLFPPVDGCCDCESIGQLLSFNYSK